MMGLRVLERDSCLGMVARSQSPQTLAEQQLTEFHAPDPLYLREHPLLWSRNRCRYRVVSWPDSSDARRASPAATDVLHSSTTALISSNMALHALSTGRTPMVVTAMTMLKQMLFQWVPPPPLPRTS